jgi:hypothetical protein
VNQIGQRQQRQQQQQHQPAAWPALKSVKVLQLRLGFLDMTESLDCAILPLPHPGLGVEWPARVNYIADVPPHPQFGYMSVVHMQSVKFSFLRVAGQHLKPALQAMVQHKTVMSHLSVYGLNDRPEVLGCDDVATYFAFDNLADLSLDGFTIGTSEFFRQLFLYCPMLNRVSVGKACLQNLDLPSFLHAPDIGLRYIQNVYIQRPEPENMAIPWS